MGIFGTDTGAPIVIKSDKAVVKLGGKTLLASGVNITFQRSVAVLPVLNKKRVMSVSEGSGTISTDTMIIADSEYDITTAEWLDGGCSPVELIVSFRDEKCRNKSKEAHCYGCIVSSVSLQMAAGRGYVMSGLTIVFTGLEFSK